VYTIVLLDKKVVVYPNTERELRTILKGQQFEVLEIHKTEQQATLRQKELSKIYTVVKKKPKRVLSAKHKKNLSKARKGKKNPAYGTKWTEERREHMKRVMKGKANRKGIPDKPITVLLRMERYKANPWKKGDGMRWCHCPITGKEHRAKGDLPQGFVWGRSENIREIFTQNIGKYNELKKEMKRNEHRNENSDDEDSNDI